MRGFQKLSILVIFLIPMSLFGQDSSGIKFMIGPQIGWDFTGYSVNEFSAVPSSADFTVDPGSASNPFFSISAAIPISGQLDKFFIIDVGVLNKSGDFVNGIGPIADSLIFESASLEYAELNVGFKYNMVRTTDNYPSMFGIEGYFNFGYALRHQFTTTIDSVSESSLNTLKSEKVLSNINGINFFRMAIGVGVTYDIPLSSAMILTPSLMDEFPLTKVDNTSRNWTIKSFYVGAALRFFVR